MPAMPRDREKNGPRGSSGHRGLAGAPQLGRVIAQLKRDAAQLDVVPDCALGGGDDGAHVGEMMDLDADRVPRLIDDRAVLRRLLVDGDPGGLDVDVLDTLRLDRLYQRGHLGVCGVQRIAAVASRY